MVFSSLTYLLLFMPCVLLGYRLMPQKARMPFLLAASLLFYGWGSPRWLLLLAWCVLVSWGGTLLMTRGGKNRRVFLILIIILDLLPLFWFKYAGFFRDTIRDLTGWDGFAAADALLERWFGRSPGIKTPVLPAGISFFTFQAISYVIDVWRKDSRPQRSPVIFGVYLSLFPQLVAGPIVRYIDLEKQLIEHPRPTWAQMRHGIRRFSVGLAKKVLLADALGRFWGQMNADLSQAGALGAWMGLLAFSFQIYFDFSGYSDMAIGLGEALGFVFPENFSRPYRAESLTGFWRRWHISLTTWFTEYVYIPLGGNRCSPWRRDLNVFFVWALTGLWHGAGWHFVLWGLYFAVLLILEKHLLHDRPFTNKGAPWVRRLITFVIVMIGWGLFSGFGTPLFSAMFGFAGFASSRTALTCLAFVPLLLLCGLISFAPVLPRIQEWRFTAPILFLLCLAALVSQGYAPFVYFQF